MFYSFKRKEREGRRSLAIKLDMDKAYDNLEWTSIEKALEAYGFNPPWIKIIMTLVTTVTYKFKVNGVVSQRIVPQRGLRQGDPLSPYLFILAVDALSHMINKAHTQGLIKGIQLTRDSPTLTYLFFANDVVLF